MPTAERLGCWGEAIAVPGELGARAGALVSAATWGLPVS